MNDDYVPRHPAPRARAATSVPVRAPAAACGTHPSHAGRALRTWSAPAALIACVLAALVIAACGATATPSNGVVTLVGSDPGSSAAPSASPMSPEDAMLAYARCMRSHGVNLPDPKITTGAGGQSGTIAVGGVDLKNQPGFEAAQKACEQFMDDMAADAPGRSMSPEEQEGFLNFAKCMREHGIDMPDPVFSGGGVSIQIGDPNAQPKIGPGSAQFQAAQEACNHFIADARPDKSGDPGGPFFNSQGGGSELAPPETKP